MKPTVTLVAALLLTGGAQAGDVYVTKDPQGHPVYTDTPQTIPAEKLAVHSTSTDPNEVQKRNSDQMKQNIEDNPATPKPADASQAKKLTADDRAKRCMEARERYQTYMEARRLYEDGPNGERHYLTNEEIDSARATSKQVMDQFCGGQ